MFTRLLINFGKYLIHFKYGKLPRNNCQLPVRVAVAIWGYDDDNNDNDDDGDDDDDDCDNEEEEEEKRRRRSNDAYLRPRLGYHLQP